MRVGQLARGIFTSMYAPWVTPFLTALRKQGTVVRAAQQAGISSAAAYALRNQDADFAEAWRLAKLDHAEICQEELVRRGMGYEEPVVYQGQLTPVYERDATTGQIVMDSLVGTDGKPVLMPRQERNPDGSLKWLTITKFSDSLLLAHVKSQMPEYATTRTEVTGANGGPVAMTDATTRRARIASLLEAAKSRVGLA